MKKSHLSVCKSVTSMCTCSYVWYEQTSRHKTIVNPLHYGAVSQRRPQFGLDICWSAKSWTQNFHIHPSKRRLSWENGATLHSNKTQKRITL